MKKIKQPNITPLWYPSASLALTVITIAVVITYGHTLSVPFYLDDYSSIVDNSAVTQGINLLSLWDYTKLRIIGYLSFAINYSLHGPDPKWFHFTNIVIHIFAGFAVFLFISALNSISLFHQQSGKIRAKIFPITVALLFVLHPLQTQAVTYIVQRLTSLTAFFYISSLPCFLYARLTEERWKQLSLFAACFLFGSLAFFTKQNSFTLPFCILLLDLLFFPKPFRQMIYLFLALLAILSAFWICMAFFFQMDPFSITSLSSLTRETVLLSRIEYFLTQTRVLWIYIGLFFWPAKLHFDPDIAISYTFFSSDVLISLFLHLLIIGTAVRFVRRQPLVSFGILFFYLGHSIESGFIPIRDVYFEHRTYLPNLGLCIISGSVLTRWLPQKIGKKQAYLITCILLCILAMMTWKRNSIWDRPDELWRDSALHAPHKARPWNELAKHLLQQGDNSGALDIFLQTMHKSYGLNDTAPDSPKLDQPAAVNLVIAIAKKGEYEGALEVANQLLEQYFSPLNHSRMLNNKGNILFKLERFKEAESSYEKAINLDPDNYNAIYNLGSLWATQKKYKQAEILLKKIPPSSPSCNKRNKILRTIQKEKEEKK
ncbi:MAG: tetratricopeptide repeat protein [Deltaproteobacteria bacterium]|nr:tetratricopeptide repeat protein [Deltaproteobacteria bacterium]